MKMDFAEIDREFDEKFYPCGTKCMGYPKCNDDKMPDCASYQEYNELKDFIHAIVLRERNERCKGSPQ